MIEIGDFLLNIDANVTYSIWNLALNCTNQYCCIFFVRLPVLLIVDDEIYNVESCYNLE